MTRTTRATATQMTAAGLLAVFTLTACDSGGSDAKDHTSTTSSAAATATSGGGTAGSGGTGGTADNAGKAEGSWLTTSGGRAVVLMVTGKQAALFSTEGTTCSGTAGEEAGKQVVHLRDCKSRTTGTVDSVNKTTLRITWEGGLGQEKYTRSDGPALPSGLPTASLGS
ncbi:hypothetical protein ACF1B0_25675 [Streptomyces anandii]|uniref:hypothetical protein n=1 Tax=Streptomyces anandii TaxID=285454 RepID=UPI0036FF6DCF